jgi:filamentous hemagglutinin family protein
MSNATPHNPSASANKAARCLSRFVPVSVRPVVFKLSRKLSVTYWPSRRRSISAMLLALLSGFVPGLAGAAPTGSQVVAGSATVLKPTATTTQINQASQNVIINWQSFSIGAGEAVRFVQPSASAVALNRVIGSDPSRIFGTLQANGKVFLVNSAGVYFAPGAKVDVGGLVASSMTISNASFLSGKYTFDATAQAGAVANYGQLRGAFVVLAAPQVTNAGNIVTTGGATALAAGGRVSLDIAGDKLVTMSVDAAVANAAVVNSGSVNADGGKVFMSASSANAVLDTVINTSGIVRAASIANRNGQIVIDGGSAGVVKVSGTLAASGAGAGVKGGAVQVLGDKVALQNGASIDVSGDTGGGSALVGGDLHGAGGVKTAAFTQVDTGAVISADALVNGNGGKVVVWADQHTGFGGAISAKGGALGGDGGFVETSGKATLAFAGKVNTTAAHGATGSLLLDPTDITIANSPTSGGSFGGGTFHGAVATSTSTLDVADLVTALGGTNVIVDTASAAAGTGNIVVANNVVWNSINSLTLKAAADITNNAIIKSDGTGAINLNADGTIHLGALKSTSGAISIAGNGGGTSRAASVVGGTIDSTSGDVSIRSVGAITTGAINAGSGTISINGIAGVAITGPLQTTNSTGSAIVINAGANGLVGNGSGGDITVEPGRTVTVGAGGFATLYTGTVAGSTGLTAVVGAGSGNFRYNSAAGTDNFRAVLTPGVSAVYREQPTLTVGLTSNSLIYGDAFASYNGLLNGDAIGQAFSTAPVVNIAGAVSTSSHLVAGTHAVTASVTPSSEQLGYNVTTLSGTLTVTPKALTSSGSTVSGKTYDGTATATVNTAATTLAGGGANSGDGKAYAGDIVNVNNVAVTSGTFVDLNAGINKTVTISGITLQGADAANYTVTTSTALATIAQKTLTATATADNRTYDGGLVATAVMNIDPAGLIGTETLTGTGVGVFSSKDAANAIPVTVNSVTLINGSNGGLASNYSLTAGQASNANITPKTLTASASAPSKVYDGNAVAAPVLSITAGLVASEALGVSGTGTFNNQNVVSANLVTVNSVTLANGVGGIASNYSLASGQHANASITPKALTATATADNRVYDGSLAATAVMNIDATGLIAGEMVTGTGVGVFSSKNAANAIAVTVNSVTLANGANGLASNYSLNAGQNSIANITPKALTATATADNRVYDGGFVATAVMNIDPTGLIVGEALTGTGVGVFSTKDVASAIPVTINSVTLTNGANGLASNYSLSAGQNSSANITPKALTASVVAANKIYDGNFTAAPTLTITAGLVAGEALGVSGTAAFGSKDAANAIPVAVNSVTLANGAGGLASNYSLAPVQTSTANITPKALTATATADNRVYDGGFVATAVMNINAGLVSGETVTGTGVGVFSSKDAANAIAVTVNTVTLADGAGGLASNYSLVAGQTSNADITPKALTATATANNRAYDGGLVATALMNIDATGLIAGETVTGTGVGVFSSKDAANTIAVTVNTVTLADGAGGLASNYSLTGGQTSNANITPKILTATATANNRAYDGSLVATAVMNIDPAGLVSGETVTGTGVGVFSSKNFAVAIPVIVNSVTLADGVGGLASNYSLAAGQASSANITRKALTASVAAPNKIYDGNFTAAPTLTITAGLVAGEALGVAGTATFSSKDAANAIPVTVNSVTLADGVGGFAGNYFLVAGQTTNADITPKALTATATANNRAYDGSFVATAVMNINAAGLVSGETVTGTGVGVFGSKDAANTIAVTVNTVTLADGAGGLASNYSLAAGQTSNANITPKALTASASAPSKVYDGNAVAAPVLSITAGLVGAEALGVSGAGTFNNENVVGANLVTVNSVTLANGGGGGIATNYSLAAGQTANASITPKVLTASVSASGKVYDGTTTAANVLTVTSGLVGGETVNASGSAVFNSKDVLEANQVTVQSTALSDGGNGGKASNYSLAAGEVASNVHITAKPLTATAVSGDKVYDGNLRGSAVISIAGAGLVGSETVVASGTGLFNSKDVGSATSLLVNAVLLANGANGGLASNYSVGAGQSVAAKITRRPSVTFIGAAGGNWSDATNWEVGAIPDLANVANVIIPAGKSVTFNSSVPALNGAVQLDSIDGAGALMVGSGTLTVANALKIGSYAQSDGVVGAGTLSAASGFNETGGKLTVGGKADMVQSSGVAILGDLTAAELSIGGSGAAQTAAGTVLVKGTVTLDTGAGDVVLANKKNDFGTVAIVSAHDVTLADINGLIVNGKVAGTLKTNTGALTVGPTTVGGNFIASALGAINQTGALDVTGSTIIDSVGLLSLDDRKNVLRGRVKLTGGADVLLAWAGNLAIGGDVGGKLVLTGSGPVIQTAGDALHVAGTSSIDAGAGAVTLTEKDNHFGGALSLKGGAVSVIDKGALALGESSVTGSLSIISGGALTQAGALAVGGAASINAAGQAITLTNAGNDFAGDLSLTGAAIQVTDKNALALGSGDVKGNLQLTAKGDVTQKGVLTVSGATAIDTTGAVVLGNEGNDFVGAVSGTGSSILLKDKNVLTVTKLTASKVDLGAGSELQVAPGGIVDAPDIALSLSPTAVKGAIGTPTNHFQVRNGARVVLGSSTPAVPTYIGGDGAQVVVGNLASSINYSNEAWSMDARSRVNSSFANIMQATQKKADSNADLIERGLPTDLTAPIPYPHEGAMRTKSPDCNGREGCN